MQCLGTKQIQQPDLNGCVFFWGVGKDSFFKTAFSGWRMRVDVICPPSCTGETHDFRVTSTPSSKTKELGTSFILLMDEILHQLIGSLSHYSQGFIHPWWCRISSINCMLVRKLTCQGLGSIRTTNVVWTRLKKHNMFQRKTQPI